MHFLVVTALSGDISAFHIHANAQIQNFLANALTFDVARKLAPYSRRFENGIFIAMNAYDLMLFTHIAILLFGIVLTGVMYSSVWSAARAATVAELRMVSRPQKLASLFAPTILGLLGSGAALIQMSKEPDKFNFGQPFAWTAIVVLVFLFLNGPLILGRHEMVLRRALAATTNGPLTTELRSMTIDPTVWFFEYINTAIVFGVVLNMTNKPSLLWCVVDILAWVIVGGVLAMFGLSRARMAALVTD